MACNLTKGRNITCRDGIGGIKAVYFVQHDELTSYVASSGEVTDLDLGSGDDIYKYTLKRGTGSITETVTASSENGSVFFTHACNIKLHDLTKEDQNEIRILAQQRLVVFAELNQLSSGGKNKIVALGLDNGMELTNAISCGLYNYSIRQWCFHFQRSCNELTNRLYLIIKGWVSTLFLLE